MYDVIIRGDLYIHVIEGKSLANTEYNYLNFFEDYSDPWAEVIAGDERILSTSVKVNTLNPKWDAKAIVPICLDKNFLILKAWDDDFVGKNLIGESKISLEPVNKFWEKFEWIELNNKRGRIKIWVKFKPFQLPANTLKNEPLNADFLYFKPRQGDLHLYQDAHVQINDGTTSESDSIGSTTFDDIALAFENAKHFICIAGWSVWTDLHLKRTEKDETLGQLIKQKADDGVQVFILIWNEKYSSKLCRELIGTHNLETENFFQNSKVKLASVDRQSGSNIAENLKRTIYTHHMKLVISDCPRKGLIAFVGGLDLTDGRWDTPDHYIWKSLSSFHKFDFYNGFVGSANADTGPREPWHDIHSKLEGEIVQDLLTVFGERLQKQASDHYKAFSSVLSYRYTAVESRDNSPKWSLQALRTSDSDSSAFSLGSELSGINDVNNCLKDLGYQHGIISLIRSAKKFIYIENQYFVGSAFAWSIQRDTCAPNLVPLEIAEQICDGIRNGNGIRAYIVLPLCPEGDSSTKVGASYMADIVLWQYNTIQMMYRHIAKTLMEVGSSDHPEDYLLFLCLGKKLLRSNAELVFPSRAKEGTDSFEWQRKSRFLIYVHSKMIITDDARIILGSANFNERSLNGQRDTEAGIAGSQVDYSKSKPELVTDGEVANFRKKLWAEHTGGLINHDESLNDPSSKECISKIRTLASQSLHDYANDSIDKDVTFRFLKYPLQVDKNGDVSQIPDIPNIPDFNIPVTGRRSFIPANVTT